MYQNVTIGGQTRSGEDAVNPLTIVILASVGNLGLPQPNLSVRYHSGVSDQFMRACIRVIEKGFGMPAFKNDEIVIPSLIKLGVETEDAFDYSAIGCIEVAVPGQVGLPLHGHELPQPHAGAACRAAKWVRQQVRENILPGDRAAGGLLQLRRRHEGMGEAGEVLRRGHRCRGHGGGYRAGGKRPGRAVLRPGGRLHRERKDPEGGRGKV